MTTEERWPVYMSRAAEAGVRSSLAVPVPVQEHVLAALNIYSRRPHAFGEDELALGRAFAAQAAVAETNAHLYETAKTAAAQLEEAMQSRAVIEQAAEPPG